MALEMSPSLDFKSLVDEVQDRAKVEYYMSTTLRKQEQFIRWTPPSETFDWNDEELQKFKVIPANIDRLYFMEGDRFPLGEAYGLLARVRYRKKDNTVINLFIKLWSFCLCISSCPGYGYIFVTSNDNLFFQTAVVNTIIEISIISLY